MEIVNPLERSDFEIVLWNAMCADLSDNIVEKFGIKVEKQEVQVQVLVNGVEVPFLEATRQAFASIKTKHDEYVRKAAMEMLQGSRLYDLVSVIEQAEWRIKDEIDRLEVPR